MKIIGMIPAIEGRGEGSTQWLESNLDEDCWVSIYLTQLSPHKFQYLQS
jgi:hypothetical protein